MGFLRARHCLLLHSESSLKGRKVSLSACIHHLLLCDCRTISKQGISPCATRLGIVYESLLAHLESTESREDRETTTGAVQDVQAEDPEAEDQNAQEGAL